MRLFQLKRYLIILICLSLGLTSPALSQEVSLTISEGTPNEVNEAIQPEDSLITEINTQIDELKEDVRRHAQAACCTGVPGVELDYTNLDNINLLTIRYINLKKIIQDYNYINENPDRENITKIIWVAVMLTIAFQIITAQMYLGQPLNEIDLSFSTFSLLKDGLVEVIEQYNNLPIEGRSGILFYQEDQTHLHIQIHPSGLQQIQMAIEIAQDSNKALTQLIFYPILQNYYSSILKTQTLRGIEEITYPDVRHLIEDGYFSFHLSEDVWKEIHKKNIEERFEQSPQFKAFNEKAEARVARFQTIMKDIEESFQTAILNAFQEEFYMNSMNSDEPSAKPATEIAHLNFFIKKDWLNMTLTPEHRNWILRVIPQGIQDLGGITFNSLHLEEFKSFDDNDMKAILEIGSNDHFVAICSNNINDDCRRVFASVFLSAKLFAIRQHICSAYLSVAPNFTHLSEEEKIQLGIIDHNCKDNQYHTDALDNTSENIISSHYFNRHLTSDFFSESEKESIEEVINMDETKVNCENTLSITFIINCIQEDLLQTRLENSALIDSWIEKALTAYQQRPEQSYTIEDLEAEGEQFKVQILEEYNQLLELQAPAYAAQNAHNEYMDKVIQDVIEIVNLDATIEHQPPIPVSLYGTIKLQKDFELYQESEVIMYDVLRNTQGSESYFNARAKFNAQLKNQVTSLTNVDDIYHTNDRIFIDPDKVRVALNQPLSESIALQSRWGQEAYQQTIAHQRQVLENLVNIGQDMGFFKVPSHLESLSKEHKSQYIPSVRDILSHLQPPQGFWNSIVDWWQSDWFPWYLQQYTENQKKEILNNHRILQKHYGSEEEDRLFFEVIAEECKNDFFIDQYQYQDQHCNREKVSGLIVEALATFETEITEQFHNLIDSSDPESHLEKALNFISGDNHITAVLSQEPYNASFDFHADRLRDLRTPTKKEELLLNLSIISERLSLLFLLSIAGGGLSFVGKRFINMPALTSTIRYFQATEVIPNWFFSGLMGLWVSNMGLDMYHHYSETKPQSESMQQLYFANVEHNIFVDEALWAISQDRLAEGGTQMWINVAIMASLVTIPGLRKLFESRISTKFEKIRGHVRYLGENPNEFNWRQLDDLEAFVAKKNRTVDDVNIIQELSTFYQKHKVYAERIIATRRSMGLTRGNQNDPTNAWMKNITGMRNENSSSKPLEEIANRMKTSLDQELPYIFRKKDPDLLAKALFEALYK